MNATYPMTMKAIQENFPGQDNAGLRKKIRESVVAGEGVPSCREIGLTAFGKASLEAIRETFAAESK